MPRPKKDSEWVRTRIDKQKRDKLEALLVSLGYAYPRDGKLQPAWGEWLEAIADGEILMHKKINITP